MAALHQLQGSRLLLACLPCAQGRLRSRWQIGGCVGWRVLEHLLALQQDTTSAHLRLAADSGYFRQQEFCLHTEQRSVWR